ncbi:MAG: hypothetical protein ACKVP0_07255 [Pirellulaceae bacterium]
MYSKETLEHYRRMTDSERLAVALKMMEEQFPYLLEGPPEVVKRRFELINRENDLRNQRYLEAFARSKKLT